MHGIEEKKEREDGTDVDGNQTRNDRRVVLRYSKRGMNILKNHMREDYCREAAGQILDLEKGTILLTTGFYVAGHAETDGPLGTLVMPDALQKLGYHPVIVTDEFCRGFFENEGLEVYYAGVNDEAQEYDRMLETYRPVGLISIERCGRNVEDDYAICGESVLKNTLQVQIGSSSGQEKQGFRLLESETVEMRLEWAISRKSSMRN